MLNRVILMGRITHDLELKQIPNGTSVLSFSIAVERNYAKQGEDKQTDFITCVAWQKTAEFISRYFGKGRMIAIEGNLRTRSYDDKNGVKHNVVEVFVDGVSFTGEPKQSGSSGSYSSGGSYSGNNNNYRSNQQSAAPSQSNNNDDLSIGDLADYEDVLSDDGVPF